MPQLNINNDNTAAMRDYNHAAKTFTSEAGYTLAPYSAFLFHVVIYFNIGSGILQSVPRARQLLDNRVLAVLVSEAELPTVGYQTETLNQYNKKKVIKKKVEYEPINLVFKDDVAQKVRTLWQLYNSQYNSDQSKEINEWKNTNTYYNGEERRWGLDSRFSTTPATEKFIDKIEIYSMGNQIAHVNTLINPIISKAEFDSHSYSEGGKTMTVNFDIEYEGIKYTSTTTDDMTAFGSDNLNYYDQVRSNLGQRSLDRGASPAGIINSVDDFINRVERTVDVIRSIDNLTDFLFFTGNNNTARQIDTISGKVSQRTSKSFSQPQYVRFKRNLSQTSANSPAAYNFPDVDTFVSKNTQGARTLDEESRGVAQSPTPEQIISSQPVVENSTNRSRANQVPTSTQLNIRYSTASDNSRNFANVFVNKIEQSRSVSSNGVNIAADAQIDTASQSLSTSDNSALLISPTVPPNLTIVELQLFNRLYPPLPSTDPRTSEPPYV